MVARVLLYSLVVSYDSTFNFQFSTIYCLVADKVLASHLLWLLQTHDVEDRRSHVSETSVLNGSRVVVSNVDERNRVQ